MKKLNNKGMTLVELIVSFMIVSVAMLYFFQTLRTVQKIYKKSFDKTTEYIDWDYALRITAAFVEGSGGIRYQSPTGMVYVNNYLSGFSVNSCSTPEYGFNTLLCYEVQNDTTGEIKKLYFYLPFPAQTDPAFNCYNFTQDGDGNITGISSRKSCEPYVIPEDYSEGSDGTEEGEHGFEGDYVGDEDDMEGKHDETSSGEESSDPCEGIEIDGDDECMIHGDDE